MMNWLRNVSCAFSGGVVGALVLMILVTLQRGLPAEFIDFKHELYRLLVWGGIWALLLVIPVWFKRWFLRGSIVGLIVILFNFIVLMPLTGAGYFAVHAGWSMFFGNIILNYIWGVVAGYWHYRSLGLSTVTH